MFLQKSRVNKFQTAMRLTPSFCLCKESLAFSVLKCTPEKQTNKATQNKKQY